MSAKQKQKERDDIIKFGFQMLERTQDEMRDNLLKRVAAVRKATDRLIPLRTEREDSSTRDDLEKRVLALKKARVGLQKNERKRPPPTKPKKKVRPPTKPKKKPPLKIKKKPPLKIKKKPPLKIKTTVYNQLQRLQESHFPER